MRRLSRGLTGWMLLLAGASGCEGATSTPPGTELAVVTAAPTPSSGSAAETSPLGPSTLDPADLTEALRALRPYVASGDSVLEVRARADGVVLQVRVAETSTVAEYVYDGRVRGPMPTHIEGSGELEKNLYELDAVDWDALTRLFPAARDAVDPADGRVTEIVVRRYLPFDRKVRARLYVTSPRMSGHLDADAKGKALGP